MDEEKIPSYSNSALVVVESSVETMVLNPLDLNSDARQLATRGKG